jgi:hypothetical protein
MRIAAAAISKLQHAFYRDKIFGFPHWTPFVFLILEAAYEVTTLAALLNARRGKSNDDY